MSIEIGIILVVAVFVAAALLAARAGIRSIQHARKVSFFRLRRAHMLAGWKWLLLALLLFSFSVASALVGEPVANQLFPPTPGPTASPTATPLPTLTLVPTATRTDTPTVTLTSEFTLTPTPTSSVTATPSQTASPTRTATQTATLTSTSTATPSPTLTGTATATSTLPTTATASRTPSRTPIPTPDRNATSTAAARILQTERAIAALSQTPTETVTPSPTATMSQTPSPTATVTPSRTATVPPTATQTFTATPSLTPTMLPSPSLTPTATLIPTETASHTPSPTFTATSTATLTPSHTATSTFTPAGKLTPSRTPTPDRSCDRIELVDEVNVPRYSVFAPDTSFTKVWRLKNAGTCTWTTSYRVALVSGDLIGGQNLMPLPTEVAPGETIDLAMDFTAPRIEGFYSGNWQLRNERGEIFDMAATANRPFSIAIRVRIPPLTGKVYDFATNACSAQWSSAAGTLTCPGPTRDNRGVVSRQSLSRLENGRIVIRPSLLTVPENTLHGYIRGIYPPFGVQEGDRFQAMVNCQAGATSCRVLFRLDYQIANGPVLEFWEVDERYDGDTATVDVDLSSLAGRDVKFMLTVLSLGTAAGDRAIWVEPRITRTIPSVTLTPTPSN